MLEFDEQTAQRLVKVYTTPDVVEQRRATREILALQPGERVLDVGSGPGFLAAEMAEEVGADGHVAGVDPSESMLALARRHAPAAEFQAGGALELPFPDASFEAVVSTQVLEYVEDVAAALAEARRVLRPGGRVLVLDTDWDSTVWRTAEPERMRRVMAAWAEHLADPYLPRRLPRLLREAGLELTHASVLPILNHPYDTDTYSAGMIPMVASFVPGRQGVTDAEAAAWRDELTGQGEDYFFSLNRYVFVAEA
jgi:ubiquinone/menaquinone biosynthesis C-methylase UbiE